MAVLLRPGKTPLGVGVRILIKHLVRRIRRHWPRTWLTFRGDSHYGRREAMGWCEDNGVDYIFGLAGNAVLHALADETADDIELRHAETGADQVRGFASFDYAAGSWDRLRRAVARLEATTRGFDARYIVTSLTGEPRHLYEGIAHIGGTVVSGLIRWLQGRGVCWEYRVFGFQAASAGRTRWAISAPRSRST